MANARKHQTPDETDLTVTRETIFETFGNSIHDIVPVANVTERSLLVAAMTAAGVAPSTSNQLTVFRADAPGMSRVEHTTDGTTWIPGAGLLRFASRADAISFGTANTALLSVGDRCVAGSRSYVWSGTGWVAEIPTTGILFGTTPTTESRVFIQAGTVVATVSTAGDGMNVTFPVPFPNGLISFVPTNGDAGSGPRVRGAVNPALTGCGVKWENVSESGLLRANWFAAGW